MTTLFVIICLAFISLGLPDSLLGAIWPSAQIELGAALSTAGIISTVVCAGTIISSLFSARIINKFKTAPVTIISVLMTAVALVGYSYTPSVLWVFIFAIPLGLGAGSVDAALNNYVALHYQAKHMSWLHCFWGVGATLGPVIISLLSKSGWRTGVRTISLIQFVLVIVLILSLPLWKRQENQAIHTAESSVFISNRDALKIPGLKYALLSFFCYCGVELTTGLWSASYLVGTKGISPSTAAAWVSLYYGGITIGRFVLGFVLGRTSSKTMIRLGTAVCALGTVILALPLPDVYSLLALLLIGAGAAPIYPCLIHETPARFGKAASQSAIGLQMAAAYIGSTVLPPVFGFMAQYISITLLPYYLLTIIALMFIAGEQINRFIKQRTIV
ncbi:MAG: MFS transporter [Oscillospiraceae bacterium]